MKISTAGIKLIACGALVAVGLAVGSGTVHAAPVLVEPTADQCQMFVQIAVDEGETFAFELSEHGLDSTGCPAPAGDCHNVKDSDGDYDCNLDDGATTPPTTAGDCHNVKDSDGDYDCNLDDGATTPATTAGDCHNVKDLDGDYDCNLDDAAATGASENVPTAVVQGVTVSNAAPAAATPANAPTLSTPVLAAAAAPAATTVKALPLTGGDITGIVLLALASLGIGGALLLADKRRRLAA
jgi:LPXTG-motif cell wall-anchored protein